MLYYHILCVALSLSVITGRAPGDGDDFCTNTLPVTDGVVAPVHPSNAKILMDSFDYLNLLPPHDTPAWQRLDLDDNNEPGEGTEWSQNSNDICRQSVTVCGFNEGPQNNWLITQYISRTVGDILLSQVSVQVEFELTGCTDLMCQRTFLLNEYETSTENSTAARDTRNYQIVTRVATEDDTGLTRQNQTREIDFESEESGFYVAIVDESTCVAVTRIIVFYNACPGGNEELVMRPETIAPIVERISIPIEVTAECVAGASPDNGDAAVKLNCNQGGTWTTIPGSGCSCNPGFNTSDDGRSCLAQCVSGQYYSVLNEECRDCPENSEGMESGLSECPCEEGYYRASGEEDFPCTQPPSMPRNFQVSAQTSTSITFTWDAPEDLGGRTDISYELCWEQAGAAQECMTYDTTVATVNDLVSGVEYCVSVRAKNGVSDMVPLELRNASTAPGVVTSTSGANITPIIAGVVCSIVVVLLVIAIIVIGVIVYWSCFGGVRSKYTPEHQPIAIPVSKHSTYVDPTTYTSVDEAIEEFAKEIAPKTLSLDAEIGSGEFGTVFRGTWKEQPKKQVAVAIKTLKPSSSGKMRTDFLNEASIMGQFKHEHVIKLYGVVTRVDPAMIVMEFMDNGSLYSYLRKNDEKLQSQQLLKMIRGVCSGMEYLSTVGYVHRDLATRNVLVSRDEVCKVADFGLSREVIDDEYNVQRGGKIPVRWTAPEAIYRRKFTSSSDVWSFGVLMWEVMTYAQHPYDDMDNQMVLDQLEAGYRLELPHGCSEAVYDIMLDCWRKELSERPSFPELLKKIESLLNTAPVVPKRPPKKVKGSGNYATNPLQCKSVDNWLESVKMERYIPQFKENGITSVNQLVHLTEPDLREMGITLAGHLHKLTQSIESGYMELKRTSVAQY